MKPITYASFRKSIKDRIWPYPGEPATLQNVHNGYFQSIMLELGKWVKGLTVHNTTVHRACNCYVQRGVTVIPEPTGEIAFLYTIANDIWEDPAYYDCVPFKDVLMWQQALMSIWTPPANTGMLPVLNAGMHYHEVSMDSTAGRSRRGMYARYRKRLYIVPWIQSNESIVIDWDGPRREWADDDIVDLDYWTMDVQDVIKLFVQYCHERDFGTNPEAKKNFFADYKNGFAEVMAEADRKHRERSEAHDINEVRLPSVTEIEASDVPAPETVDPETEYVFANIGDYGGTTPPSTKKRTLCDLIISWDDEVRPFIITTNGDNSQTEGDDDYPTFVGDYFPGYIANTWESNRFWPCPGNHDYSANGSGNLDEYFAYFEMLAGKMFYNLRHGPVEFFFLNTGLKTLAVASWPPELKFYDAADALIAQGRWLQNAVARSTAKWKIVVQHLANFASTNANGDCYEQTERVINAADFATMGVDLLLQGNSHIYERLLIAPGNTSTDYNLHVMVNGVGATSHDTLNSERVPPLAMGFTAGQIGTDSPLVQSLYAQNEYGAIKGVATCSKLTLEFWQYDGVLKDTLELRK